MSTADKLTKITSQLVGDISRLPGVTLDSAGEQQLIQLLTDAFETVGLVALEQAGQPCAASDCGYAEPHVHRPEGIYPFLNISVIDTEQGPSSFAASLKR